MIVTREYLLEHRTSTRGWTKTQFDVLGLPWPPNKGWINQIKGRVLTDSEKEAFEAGKYSDKTSPLSQLKKLIRKLKNEELEHLRKWITNISGD